MELILNGRKVDEAYPGYQFRQSDSFHCQFDNENGDRIVEVLGEPFLIEGQGKPFLRTPIVAILRGDDAALYGLLQWKDEWRGHPAITMGHAMLVLWAYGILLVVHGLAAFMGYLGTWEWAAAAVVLCPLFEIILTLFTWKLLHFCYGVLATSVWVMGRVLRGMPRSHYHDLFVALSRAGNKDKAGAARVMARLI